MRRHVLESSIAHRYCAGDDVLNHPQNWSSADRKLSYCSVSIADHAKSGVLLWAQHSDVIIVDVCDRFTSAKLWVGKDYINFIVKNFN